MTESEQQELQGEWVKKAPTHWQRTRLRFVCGINPSKSEARDLESELEVSFLPMEKVGEFGQIVLNETRELERVISGYTYFRDRDVLVAKITPCFENGKGAVVGRLKNGIGFGSTEFHVLRPLNENKPEFIYYLTRSGIFRNLGTAAMTGSAGQQRVPTEYVKDFPLALPDPAEQAIIAAFLDQKTAALDEAVALKEKQVRLLERQRQAVITHAVTRGLDANVPTRDSGYEWLGEIPLHWTVAPVYAHYAVQLGKMLDKKQISGEHLKPYLRNVDVQWDNINVDDLPEMDFAPDERDRYRLQIGDLLVCEGGEVGRTAIWEGQLEECYYQKALHRLRPRNENNVPRFFFYIMNMAASTGLFIAESNTSTIDHLTAEKLRKHRFPFPPVDEQERIVDQLDQKVGKINETISTISIQIDKLRAYRQALISAAVTGRIDVGGAA